MTPSASATAAPAAAPPGAAAPYLPDLCRPRAVLTALVAAELLAYVLALSQAPGGGQAWQRLLLTSLFVQWAALLATAVLCAARRRMTGWGTVATTAYALGLVLAVIVVVSEAAYRLGTALEVMPAVSGGHGRFLLRNLSIGAIVAAVTLRYFYVQHQLARNIQAEAEARIQALQARVRPHFLFNTMNTIASLTRSDPALAEAAVEDLADLLRSNLADARSRVPLRDELELTRRYLHIEALRLGPRLVVDEDLQDLPPDAAIPLLTLQPLVENAVYHGIEPLPDGGTVRIAGHRDGHGLIVITVTNPVPQGSPPRRGHRLALDNVSQRLSAHFGGRARLETAGDGRCWQATLILPYERAAA